LNRNNPTSDNPINVEQVPTDSNPDDSVSRAAIYARTSVKSQIITIRLMNKFDAAGEGI